MESPLRTRARFTIAWWAPLLVATAVADLLVVAWWEGRAGLTAICAAAEAGLLVTAAWLFPRSRH
jgi:hypothetical protein